MLTIQLYLLFHLLQTGIIISPQLLIDVWYSCYVNNTVIFTVSPVTDWCYQLLDLWYSCYVNNSYIYSLTCYRLVLSVARSLVFLLLAAYSYIYCLTCYRLELSAQPKSC